MGFFDWLFGKKTATASPDPTGDGTRNAGSQPVQGPPEFVRAVELQRAYWRHAALTNSAGRTC